ncbi:thiamine pyrophosphate-dependent acetolactate synthase large subunit-like protein [Rhizobium aethiopicum]|uniref:Thiamine pyrophosphate-dependent acetolactate synthase large subunit-like protein n=1 Tax=Rhizobium aethiopicum TaxID=1138170 RepID=A0A7W6QBF4_9HYPH|nr:thiamine pyrophosphate-binding protein [Rhizobium aethiopicum]MBB4194463.1 thiamine pyrophosphate-dependent acetolactate synthase large subunit-like protein [Rhizobium aethiopicum]MBB4582142.1 thiamine pyrophosphate-dependent acetolactate synthase large subunit-like protein [Rhizobium aethiopicum]
MNMEIQSDKITLNGGQALVRILKSCGIENVYGVVGGAFGPFLAALSKDNSMRYVGARHEAAGAFMAAAEFYSTGRIAVCLGEQGPGGLNLLSGLGVAYNNNLALLAITTNISLISAYPHEGKLMDADHKRLFEGLTGWNATINDVSRLPALVRRALRNALTGCPTPVHLDIPMDVLVEDHHFDIAELDMPLSRFLPAGRRPADAASVMEAARLLATAERPLVIAGAGVSHSGGQPELMAVTELLGAAATSTMTGAGSVPSTYAGFVGCGGVIGGPVIAQAMREADVVLAVGCKFSSYLWETSRPVVKGWPRQQLIQIDIDPVRLGQAAPLALGLLGDARVVLTQLREALERQKISSAPKPWVAGLSDAFRTYLDALGRAQAHMDGGAIHPAALARTIGGLLGENGLVVLDGGHTCFWGNALTPAAKTRTRFNDACMAQLGFGLPFAIALKHLHPQELVVNITGDGSFGFTLSELDTARRHGLPVISIIHNNAGWGIIDFGQKLGGYQIGGELSGTDYAEIAKGFGCFGEVVTDLDEFPAAFARAVASNLPAVLDVRVGFVPHPQMPAFGRIGLAQPRHRGEGA